MLKVGIVRDTLSRAVGLRVVEPVAGGVQGHSRRKPPAGTQPRPRDRAQRMPAHAVRAREIGLAGRQREAVQLRFRCKFEAAAEPGEHARAELRRALVRRDDERCRIGVAQHLPALHAAIQAPVAGRAIEALLPHEILRQQARRQAFEHTRKVLPVRVVGRARVAQLHVGSGQRLVLMAQSQGVAVAAGHAIAGQQVQVGRTAVRRIEIAELAVEGNAAPRQDAGREGGVALRRDVPVVRQREFEAALAVEVDAWRQPAGLARVGERKAEHRRAQDRHAEKAQHGAFGDAFVGLEVELDPRGLEQPVGAARVVGRAARVGGADRLRALLVDEVDALGAPACARARKEIGRVEEVALEALHAQLQLAAGVDVSVAADAHVAACAREVIGMFVAQLIGADDHAAAAKLGVAAGHGLEVGAAADFVGTQNDRQRLARLATRRRAQLRHASQRRGRVGHLRERGRHERERQRERSLVDQRKRRDESDL